MHRVYLGLGSGIILLGIFHIAATPQLFTSLTNTSIWFAIGGVAIVLTGALNLLRRIYGEVAPGVRMVCIGTNLVMTGLSLLAGYAGRASPLQYALVLGLLGGATVLSVLPAAQRPLRRMANAA